MEIAECNDPSTLEPDVLDCPGLPFLKQDDKGRIHLNDLWYFQFLESAGFRTVRRDETINLVRIEKNIIKKVIPHDIKIYLVEKSHELSNENMTNFLLSNTRIYKPEYLYALAEIKPDVIRDTKNSAYFFFQNGVVTVSALGMIGPIPYDRCDKQIWEDKILPRNFKLVKLNASENVFRDFVWKLSGMRRERANYLWSIIGYCLHNYRTSANSKAIIFADENLSDQPEGGSGKTLLVKALGKIRTLVEKDGKTFNPRSSFQWSDVNETTDLVLLDETSSGFAFEDLFSLITSGITIEKKFLDKYRLSIEQSPLFAITTNQVIPGNSGSFARRQYTVDIHQYFSSNHTPVDEYGHLFFEDWDEEAWNQFDNFMLLCVRSYFRTGVLNYSDLESEKKRAVRATSLIFVDWYLDCLEDLQGDNGTTETWNRFLEETGGKASSFSIKRFVNNLRECCQILGHTFTEIRSSGKRGFRIDV